MNELSRFNDAEMKKLMINVVNQTYRFLWTLFNSKRGDQIIELLKERDMMPEWKNPE